MKIYTKTGDTGQTSLFGGVRVVKSDPRIECYGTVDELNSALGLVLSQLQAAAPPQQATPSAPAEPHLLQSLIEIQCQLFNLGSHLACGSGKMLNSLPPLKHEFVDQLEQWIDQMEVELPPLTNFILPGGHPVAAHLHLARTVCRRAERRLFELSQQSQPTHQPAREVGGCWLNRLSDYLFVAARLYNFKCGIKDIPWKPTS